MKGSLQTTSGGERTRGKGRSRWKTKPRTANDETPRKCKTRWGRERRVRRKSACPVQVGLRTLEMPEAKGRGRGRKRDRERGKEDSKRACATQVSACALLECGGGEGEHERAQLKQVGAPFRTSR